MRLLSILLMMTWCSIGFAQEGEMEESDESTASPETTPATATDSMAKGSEATGGSVGMSYRCKLENLVRTIAVKYANPGEKVPCEVQYDKEVESPGQTQVLWNATNMEGFCEEKTTEFVEKLRANGWECTAN